MKRQLVVDEIGTQLLLDYLAAFKVAEWNEKAEWAIYEACWAPSLARRDLDECKRLADVHSRAIRERGSVARDVACCLRTEMRVAGVL